MKPGKDYVPARGDIVWLDFNPRVGHEQAGKRPALVISPEEYNEKVGLALFCPITSKEKGYPFEIKIDIKNKIKGVILSDQLKSLDWRKRNAKYITRAGKKVMEDVIEKVSLLIIAGI
jgi:mRNA interferase MazF